MAKTPKDTALVEPCLKGRFAIYDTPDGGYHLSYRPDGADDDQHLQIPGMYVKLMRRQTAKGGLRRLLGAVT